jgi:DNA-binding IclR family transcriptional regulator
MFDIMRHLHVTYAPASEPFGARLEAFFIGLGVATGDIEGRPFSISKIALYMRTPRTRVRERLNTLVKWGLIERRGRHYHVQEQQLNALVGMLTHTRIKKLIHKTSKELSVLDTLPD